MKLTLEKNDLLQLLSLALDYELHDDEVEVQADPFEVQLKTVRLLDLAKARKQMSTPTPKPKPEIPEKAVHRTPTPQPLPTDDDGDDDLDDVLAASANLAAGLPSATIDPDVRGLNDFSRPLAGNESEEPPGSDFHGEIPT